MGRLGWSRGDPVDLYIHYQSPGHTWVMHVAGARVSLRVREHSSQCLDTGTMHSSSHPKGTQICSHKPVYQSHTFSQTSETFIFSLPPSPSFHTYECSHMRTYTFSLIHSTKTEHVLNASVELDGQGVLRLEWACVFWEAFLEEEAFQLGLGGGEPGYSWQYRGRE